MRRITDPSNKAAKASTTGVVKPIAKVFLWITFAIGLPVILFAASLFVGMLSIPSDDELTGILDRHGTELERAVELAQHIDITVAISPSPDDESSRQMADLKSILRELDVEFLWMSGCLEFVFYSTPFVHEYKGLSWCGLNWKPEPGVDNMVDFTDPYHNLFASRKFETNSDYYGEEPIYRHLRGAWYIRYEFQDWN